MAKRDYGKLVSNSIGLVGKNTGASDYLDLSIESIVPEKQVRDDANILKNIDGLAENIKRFGLIMPVVVTPIGDKKYKLIAGYRRYHAHLRNGAATIKATIKKYPDQDIPLVRIIENEFREDLTPFELARAFSDYCSQYEVTREKLAEFLGVSKTKISKTISILKLLDHIPEKELDGIGIDVLYELSTKVNEKDFQIYITAAKESRNALRSLSKPGRDPVDNPAGSAQPGNHQADALLRTGDTQPGKSQTEKPVIPTPIPGSKPPLSSREKTTSGNKTKEEPSYQDSMIFSDYIRTLFESINNFINREDLDSKQFFEELFYFLYSKYSSLYENEK